ncbi:uncharacterized protein LOC135813791 [Sycon ciliatum]|uniref:uncharacterized protein LOC135813791 n=1 Tax=Sycon ciliatum TaxID=27933 RepID=UPI0031F6F711|eukprot:scpid67204/ scgid17970/ RNA-binding protein Nova-1; Neuro-oncological ventral antigen 1; Ventral neuron-specific protein 1
MEDHFVLDAGSPPSGGRDETGDEPDAKRLRTTFPGKRSSTVILKFLVSNHEAGSIIGSSGRTIREVHEKSGAVIKLSTAREMFPGTDKRVALLSGSRMEVEDAMIMLLDKMSADAANWRETLNELDIVVPNNTAGLIIGKGGETIKSLQQETGVRLKVSDKRDQDIHKLAERRVLLNGDLERLKQVVTLLLNMIETDPMSGSVPTVTYNNSSAGGSSSGSAPYQGAGLSQNPPSNHGNNMESRSHHHHTSRQSPNLSNMNPSSTFDSRPSITPPSLAGQVSQPICSWPGVPPATAAIELPVPSMLLDSLLNQQPSALHQIEGYSQASLHVTVNGNSKYRVISISGTLSAAETGVFLLRQKLQQQQENTSM